MRKLALALFAAVIFMCYSAYAIENSFLDMRNEISAESKKIKAMMGTSKDSIVISSMWDTCLISISQLDAYFHLLGMFNSINPEYQTQESADYLVKWLSEMRKTNDINIRLLGETRSVVQDATKSHMQVLRDFFGRLNTKIDADVNKIETIEKSMKIGKK